MHDASDERKPYACFRCPNGCIHVVANNVMLTLSEEQFVHLTRAINHFIGQLQNDDRVMFDGAYAKTVVM